MPCWHHFCILFFIYDIDVSMSCITVLLNAMLCTHACMDMPFNCVTWGHPTPLSCGFSALSSIFFWANQRPGLESVVQKESIGSVSMPWVLNLSLDNIFEVHFFINIFSGLFE
jgi:hypothetical protein